MAERVELDLIARAQAVGIGELTAMESAENKLANSSGLVASAHSKATKETQNFEQATHHATRLLGETGAGFDNLSVKAGALAGLTGFGGVSIAAVGLAAGVGLGIETVKKGIETAETAQKATEGLTQAYHAQRMEYSQHTQAVQDFLQVNRRYIDDQFAAENGIAQLTRAGLDQDTVFKAMNVAVDLAAIKHIGLSEAVRMVNLAMHGSARGVRELGIDLKSISAEADTSETALKNLDKAEASLAQSGDKLAAAQKAYNEFLDAHHGKAITSQIDLDHLHDKQDAVTKANEEYTRAQQALKTAQDESGVSTSKQIKVLDELQQKTADGRKGVTELEQAQNDLNKSQQDFAQRWGPTAARVEANAIDIANYGFQIIGLAAQHPNRVFGLPDDAPPAPSGASPDGPGPLGSGGEHRPTRGAGADGGVPGHPGMTVGTAQILGLVTSAELEYGVALQRTTEWSDRLAPTIAATAQAQQRQGEITSTVTGRFEDQTEEADRMLGHHRALEGAMYDLDVAQNSVATRTSEVASKFRDEADTVDETARRNRDAWGVTKANLDDLAKHVHDEKFDPPPIEIRVDQSQLNDTLETIRNLHRAASEPVYVQVNTPGPGAGEWGGAAAGGYPSFPAGGLVPGSLGSPFTAELHGGERVSHPDEEFHTSQSGGDVQTTVIQLVINDDVLAEAIDRRVLARERGRSLK